MVFRFVPCVLVSIILFIPAASLADVPGPISDPMVINDFPETNDTNRLVDMATDGNGNWVVIWRSDQDLDGTVGNDYDILYARSADNGVSWSSTAAINSFAASDGAFDDRPRVVTDGQGVWITAWSSNIDTGAAKHIYFSRSTDNGQNWSPAAVVDPSLIPTGVFGDDWVSLATDGLGRWVIAWGSYNSVGGTIGTDGDILFSLSTNHGVTWSSARELNSNAPTDSGEDRLPFVTTDGAGNWVCAWDSRENLGGTIGTDRDILVSRITTGALIGGLDWAPPQVLDPVEAAGTGDSLTPRVFTDGAGTWLTVWPSTDTLGGTIGTDYDMLVSTSTNNGLSWSTAIPLNTTAASDTENDSTIWLDHDESGTWLALWHSSNSLGGTIGDDTDLLYSVLTTSWSAPQPFNTNAATDTPGPTGNHDAGPKVIYEPQCGFLAAWRTQHLLSLNDDVFVARMITGCGGNCGLDDTDGDDEHDVCDEDDDNDGVDDDDDAAPLDPTQCQDLDGDACDDCAVGTDGFGPLQDADPLNDGPDADGDGVCDATDPCPLDDPDDSDMDGVCEGDDQCPGFDDTLDADSDLVPDDCDNCPDRANPAQADCDTDDIGDVCALALGISEDLNGNDIPDDCEPCTVIADCADQDGDGVRDDNCTWWACTAGQCIGTPIVFGDMGGQFGNCPADGTADNNDRNHALNCFSDVDFDGLPGYPCTDASVGIMNVDAGGQFGSCAPDGVCDGNDAFHALNAFAGANPCTCPLGGPAPAMTPIIIDVARLSLRPDRRSIMAGDLVGVDVFLDTHLEDLRGFQLHIEATGGNRGRLDLIDIVVHREGAFGQPDWQAHNVHTQQVVAGLDSAGVAVEPGSLATFVFRASKDARGAFTIELLSDHTDAMQRTYLFPTMPTDRIDIKRVKPVLIAVGRLR